jgi:hypothetical protein
MRHVILFLIVLQVTAAHASFSDTTGVHRITAAQKLSEEYKFYSILRPKKQTTVTGQTITTTAYGAGMLNADSIPVGEWKFYADAAGTQLLYKGNYRLTRPADFVMDDPSVIGKTDTVELKKNIAAWYPVLKSGIWTCYNEKGFEKNKMHFPSAPFPVVLMATEEGGIIKYVIEAMTPADEWRVDGDFGIEACFFR